MTLEVIETAPSPSPLPKADSYPYLLSLNTGPSFGAVRNTKYASAMSSNRCNPRQRVSVPGSPSPLRPRKPPQAGHHPHGLPQRRRLGRLGLARHKRHQRLPFMFLKIDRGGHRGRLPPQLGQMINPPRHHQVDAQTGFQPVGLAQTPRLSWRLRCCGKTPPQRAVAAKR